MSALLAQALLDALDDAALAVLAKRLGPYMPAPSVPAQDGWLDSKGAAAYSGCTVTSLHKAMAAREVRFEQDCKGGKAWFKRADLDEWRRSGG